ncbi:MAG: amidohydrolase family protein [Chitinophagaceae bacterium]
MSTSFFTADKIHNGKNFLPEGSAIEIDEAGTIVAIHASAKDLPAKHYSGILTPGFVNAHCHIELSHLRGLVPEHTGLIPFLQSVTGHRFQATEERKKEARFAALEQMLDCGIVAVGDIANTTDTLDIRSDDKVHIHSFVECIGFTESGASSRLQYSQEVLFAFNAQVKVQHSLSASIAPHAPYSVSETLFKLIGNSRPELLLSIHNQECAAENEFYQRKTGAVLALLKGFDIDDSFFSPSGKTSIQTYLPWLGEGHSIIFVHNTFSSKEDIQFAESHANKAFWCLCPGANLYIENALPDVMMLASTTENICIGTDSLASNHQLSVFAELQILKKSFPELEWEILIKWACYNGAFALNLDERIGTIEPGKQPGMVWLSSLEEHVNPQRIA